MNIKLIKSEIEKLSLMLSAWEQSEQVSAIERDIVLDKLKKIYDAVCFDTAIEENTPIEPTEPIAPVPAVEENDEESDEKEVEVELIFADDEFPEEDLVDEEEIEEEIEEMEQPSATDIIAATVANALAGATIAETLTEPTPEEPSVPEVIVVEPAKEEETIIVEPAIEETIVVEPAPIEVELPHEETPVVIPEPEPVAVPEEKPIEKPAEKPIEKPIEEKPAKKAAREMNSLFNMDEVRRQPRSKHQRMMSIYNSEPKQEKVVDISKIFNLDIDEPAEATPAEVAPVETKPVAKPIAEPVTKPKPVEVPVAKPIVEEKPQTLADAIPATQTLADVITAPTALAEEINNARVRSLRDGIGLNDKFLMIRDLFDGDGVAYDEAINALDAMETFDDCMIHIIENYAWNPDSEGSKFIMQLLERKLS
ncbi:MAG: hypothetical protein IKV77_04895 [Alistipes sp.]|nr:hypothetical protein [Alistipes sp.]